MAGEVVQRLSALLQAETHSSSSPQDHSSHLAVAIWGLDMVRLFKMAPGGLTHLLVVVDKFTKWIKAKQIKKLDGSSTIKFFNEIIVR
jgi:hypothetical protein